MIKLTDKNKAEIIQLLDIGVRQLILDFFLSEAFFSDGYGVSVKYSNGKDNYSYDELTMSMLSHPRRSHLIAQRINHMTKRDLPKEYKEMMETIALKDKLESEMSVKKDKTTKRIKI